MSKVIRTAAVLGMGAALALPLAGTAQAAPVARPAATGEAKVQAKACYVSFYDKKNFGGRGVCMPVGDYINLRHYKWPGTNIPMDNKYSSAKIDKVCKVQLFRDFKYKGKSSTWKRIGGVPGNLRKVPDLSKVKVGDNKVTSMKIFCAADV
ncbi:hypothetical protein GCM10009678_70400 [Actinomadura kijaniata]|uniref:Calcium-dependent cell adhesion molecule N-terminal domain-containing protein n=1 Tax=Actinomadura namibiensis TaxID=182080 RepID=A0A7W3LM01_ACTNM|nr:beta/gamma crystallin domain-containing protein [Actinomadura namibiensis]MBA8950559.1 hypothetical protein [Actinomadura namibiensis]